MNDASSESSQLTPAAFCPQMLMNAGFFGFTGVLLGAMGAHFLPGYLESSGMSPELIPKRLDQFDTGVRLPLGPCSRNVRARRPQRLAASQSQVIAGLFTIGTLLFSGSLYLLVF